MKSTKKTWKELKDNNCPRCSEELSKGMFGGDFSGCQACGFVISDDSKDILVERDHNEQ